MTANRKMSSSPRHCLQSARRCQTFHRTSFCCLLSRPAFPPSVQLVNYEAVVSCSMWLSVTSSSTSLTSLCSLFFFSSVVRSSTGTRKTAKKRQLQKCSFLKSDIYFGTVLTMLPNQLFLLPFFSPHRSWCCNQSFHRHAMTCQHLDTMFFGTDASPDVGRDSEKPLILAEETKPR